MKKVIFVTNSFPFGTGEKSFISPEFEVLKDKFDFTIVARNTKDEQTTDCPENVDIYRYNPKTSYNTLALFLSAILKPDLYKELFLCLKTKNGDRKNLINIVKVMMRSIHFSKYIKNVRDTFGDDEVIFYTYWNDFSAYASTMIKRKNDKIISRLHGADLYKVRSNNWQPYKSAINDKVDALYFISREGLEYYRKTYKDYGDKLRLAYLGVAKSGMRVKMQESDTLNLVTVSRCVGVKRLELLIDALSTIKDSKINWVHIGDGEDYDNLYDKSNRLLKGNITFEFKGYMENKDIIPYLVANSFDFLINVSYSEGLPVTMMEVMSCGMPVIATNVGGVPEIVHEGINGYLVDRDITKEKLGDLLKTLCNMSYEEKKTLSENAYKTWEEKFFDEKNYNIFAKELMDL